MKSFIILLSCLLCISSIIFAQNTKSCYTELRREGLRYVSRKDYPKAINSFFAARYCLDKPAKDDLDELIKNTQNEWVKALNNALAKSDSLIAYFGFTQDRAWAYKNGKFAVIDRNGKRLTDFEFENPEPFKESGYAIAQKADGFYYLIDKIGKVSEPYNYFFPCNNGWYKVKKGNLYTFYDKNYKQVEGWDWYEEIGQFSEGMVSIKKRELWGFSDLKGEVLIQPKFSTVQEFNDGLSWIFIDSIGYYGSINTSGDFMIKPQFLYATPFIYGLSWIQNDFGFYGLIDKKGNKLIGFEFSKVYDFIENVARVEDIGKIYNRAGFVDKTGKILIYPQFDDATDFVSGYALVEKNFQYGFIDLEGNLKMFPQFSNLKRLKNGLAAALIGDYYGYINKDGIFVIPTQFDSANDFSDGVARIEKNNKEWFIDLKGNFLFEIDFEEVGNYFSEDLVEFKSKGKYGFLDKAGKIAIPPQFERVYPFSNGLARVRIDGKLGFIDKKGIFIIEAKFDVAEDFRNRKTQVRRFGEWFYINKKGQLIIDETLEQQTKR